MRGVAFGDEGQVGGVEGLFFGVAVFVLGTLVVANAWGVIDAKFAAASAAREAARAFVESSAGSTQGALADAEEVAEATISGYGRDPERMLLVAEEARLLRCARATFRVDYPVPLITIPVLGRYGTGFIASARHSEIVDPFRGGLADRNGCPDAVEP